MVWRRHFLNIDDFWWGAKTRHDTIRHILQSQSVPWDSKHQTWTILFCFEKLLFTETLRDIAYPRLSRHLATQNRSKWAFVLSINLNANNMAQPKSRHFPMEVRASSSFCMQLLSCLIPLVLLKRIAIIYHLQKNLLWPTFGLLRMMTSTLLTITMPICTLWYVGFIGDVDEVRGHAQPEFDALQASIRRHNTITVLSVPK